MNVPFVVGSLVWVTTSLLPAQHFRSIGSEQRQHARATWIGRSGEQSVRIDYGQPKWRAEHEHFLQQAGATPLLLGNGAPTTLHTDVELTFGDQKLGRGRWYVAARHTDKDEWSLALFAADRVDATGRLHTTLLSTTPDVQVPVQVTRAADAIELFELTLEESRATPHNLRLAMAWGPLRMRAPLHAAFDTRQPEGAPAFARTAAGNGTRTTSGLLYEVLRPGKGQPPRAADRVHVHYAAWLEDGTLFDTTYLHGEPTPLRLDWVVPGFAEALQLMQPGATFRVTLPPDLAFGDRGANDRVPPGATVVYCVTLVRIDQG